MIMDKYIQVNGKNLRCGYTTGTCACGAAMFAAKVLLSGGYSDSFVTVDTPAGIPVRLEVYNISVAEDYVSCSVIKDGGDDPDVTSGLHIFARVEKVASSTESVIIEGGEGVGVVTKPGLDQPVGAYAINSTPRKYITEIVETVKKQYGSEDTLKVTIYAPEGQEISTKTFNPRMGIEGGISIIGTSGIVEPMSNAAIVQTTILEIKQRIAKGEEVLFLSPGRIGERFAKTVFDIDSDDITLCSNNIGEAFENAVLAGFKEIVFIGHIGKLVKLGYGAKNTHSANNDGRIEELVLCALKAGASNICLNNISECVTTDGVIGVLEDNQMLDETMKVLGDRIEDTINRWTEGKAKLKLCVFTNINNDARVLIKRGF